MNRLSTEKSPYLLQHAGNPVDWYPWSEEAFRKAKTENKPVFLSIGYATCHWCHVMEHESFEDEAMAEQMNRVFVNIKVDREERPDIDNTYMTVCQMLTGQGGWPLTVVMTPNKEPFFAATYLPRQSRSGRIGMFDLIAQVETLWKKNPEKIRHTADRIKAGFAKSLELGISSAPLPAHAPGSAFDALRERFDDLQGGFGAAPKFPSPHNLLFLMNRRRITGDNEALDMASFTLEKMRLGGLWDHVGGGFHRYATDREWLLPHFEKMLYDQAMLMMAYAEGWACTGNRLFKKTVRQITGYLDECLASPGGAYYSAEDADSEGEEGRFYVWAKGEIESLLSEGDSRLFCELFHISRDGNFHDEATGLKTGANIPHLRRPLAEEAAKHNIPPKTLETGVEKMLRILHRERAKRVRPLLDDKILTDWNGLMIAALSRSGIILNDPSLIRRAEKAWAHLREKVYKNGTLLHRLKDGDAAIEGMANDYTFTVWGLLELYEATFQTDYLETAVVLHQTFHSGFYDSEHGGYFFTSERAEKLLGRQKEIYDGAIPSSNSVAAWNGFRLSRLTGNTRWEGVSEQLFSSFSDAIADQPAGYTFALDAWQVMQSSASEIVLCAPKMDESAREFIALCREHAAPGSALLLKTPETAETLGRISPFTAEHPLSENIAVYLCKNFTCNLPVHTKDALIQALNG